MVENGRPEEGAEIEPAPFHEGGTLPVLPEDRKEAQRVFNSLPMKDQFEILLGARGEERLYYLFLSENPEQLMKQLPEMEVFLTVKEIGKKDAVDLISLTTPDQFQYLLDLDTWIKDRLDPERILHWMEILLESGEDKVVQFIRSSDREWIALLLKKFLLVSLPEEEPLEAVEQTPRFTLDQYYFIRFKGKLAREIFQAFLQIFSRVDGDGYRWVMEALISELQSELEETGYRFRNNRLADYGFPDFEEALEIYRFVHPDSLLPAEKPLERSPPKETGRPGPVFYLTFREEGPFLSSVLSRIDDPLEQGRLREELAVLCNKAMVAERIDLFNVGEMERVVKKVFHYLNLGLQYLSKEDERKASGLLTSMPLQKLFQAGVGTTLLLRRKAESILKGPWFRGDRENLSFLDSIYLERIEGVLRRRPALHRNGLFEEFKNLQDLKETAELLERVEALTRVLAEGLHLFPGTLKGLDLTGCHPEEWREITFSTLFLTSFANQILKGRFQFEAISKACLKDFFSAIFERDDQGKGTLRMDLRKKLKDWFDSIESDETRRDHLLAFQDFCFDLLEEQCGKIPPEGEIDPRFLKGLLVCR